LPVCRLLSHHLEFSSSWGLWVLTSRSKMGLELSRIDERARKREKLNFLIDSSFLLRFHGKSGATRVFPSVYPESRLFCFVCLGNLKMKKIIPDFHSFLNPFLSISATSLTFSLSTFVFLTWFIDNVLREYYFPNWPTISRYCSVVRIQTIL